MSSTRLVKEGIWITFGQFMTMLAGLIQVRVITGYLSPDQYGMLTLSLTMMGLVNQLLMTGITAGIGRNYSVADELGNLNHYFAAVKRVLLVCVLTILFSGFIVSEVLSQLGHQDLLLIVIVLTFFSITDGITGSLNIIQSAARQRATVAMHAFLGSWGKILVAWLLLTCLNKSVLVVLLGFALASLMVMVSQYYFANRLIRSHQSGPACKINWIRNIWQIGWPFSAWGIFTWSQQSSDRWALERFSGLEDVGQYSAITQLSYNPIIMANGLLSELFAPIIFQRMGAGIKQDKVQSGQRMVTRLVLFLLIMTALAAILMYAFHPFILSWFVALEYRNSGAYMPLLVIAGGLFSSGQILVVRIVGDMRTKEMLATKIGSSVLGLVVNILGAYYYGLAGVVYGAVIFSSVYFLSMLMLAYGKDSKLRKVV